MRRLMTFLAGVALAAAANGQTVIYVDGSGAGGDGRSWGSAYVHLQDALDAASAAPKPVEIRIAQGVYRPDRTAAVPDGTRDRNAAFRLQNQVALLGGYAGAGAELGDVRDPQAYPTVLDGDLDGNDGPNFQGTQENSYHVAVAVGVDGSAVIDGCVIRGGRADGPAAGPSAESRDRGAGLMIENATPTLIDCVIESNYSADHGAICDLGGATLTRCVVRDNFAVWFGAGLYIGEDAPTRATECVFEENETLGDGGGVFVLSRNPNSDGPPGEGEAAEFVRCRFESNRAFRGAGLFNGDLSAALLDNCTFVLNDASNQGGGAFCSTDSAPRIYHCTFIENNALTGGGIYSHTALPDLQDGYFQYNSALFGEGGGGVWLQESPTVVRRCTFVENTAFNGGGLYNGGTVCPEVEDCVFIGNLAVNDNGGGMSNVSCGPVVRNCRFIGNATTSEEIYPFVVGGGAADYIASATYINCYFEGNSALRGGGGLFHEEGFLNLINCQFYDNFAYNGGGFYSLRTVVYMENCVFGNNVTDGGPAHRVGGAIDSSFDVTLVAKNCTFYGNVGYYGGAYGATQSTAEFINCVMWGDTSPEIWDGSDSFTTLTNCIIAGGWEGPGTGNFDADPRFVDPEAGDLRLQPGSPAIDAGPHGYEPSEDGATDPLGNPRIANCVVDLGAFEFDQPTRLGDVSFDGKVDVMDINPFVSLLLGNPTATEVCRGDMNGDGVITVSDIGGFVNAVAGR
jgi:hypothetical protein